MWKVLVVIQLFICNVFCVTRNFSCPVVTTRELDWKEMDGTWYLSAVASDLKLEGDCAMVLFDHQDTLDVSIKWIINNTASFYNGTVALLPDPNSNTTGDLLQVTYHDKKVETYSFLDIDYEHYAVVFACYNNTDGNSSIYEIWKMTRSIHLKAADASKMDEALKEYNLQETPFITFNNTEDTCRVNSGSCIDTSALVMSSVAALTMFRRFY